MNIRELIETQSKKNPGKVFLYFGKQEITYEAFDHNINKAANMFLDLGIRKGDCKLKNVKFKMQNGN